MRKIFTLLFFLPIFSFSFDESYFDGQINKCVCAVKPNQCNPNCRCDPFCTDEQKKQFDFYLPETFSNNKISCDPKNRIDKTNLHSIKKEIDNGVNCYSIEGNENGKKIINFNAKDFGISNFSEAVESPFKNDKYIYNNNSIYKFGEKINVNNEYFGYLPIAIGSSTSNALLPLLAGYSYPKYGSIIKSKSGNMDPYEFIDLIAFVPSVNDLAGNKWLEFPLYDDFYNNEFVQALYSSKKFINFQYIFPFESNISEGYNTSDKNNISMRLIADDHPGDEKLPKGFLSFSFEVYFGKQANFFDNKYQDVPMGYYFGVPVMGEDEEESRKNLQINGTDVLFGVNSTIIIKIDPTNDVLNNSMMPQYKKLYKSFGNIYTEGKTPTIDAESHSDSKSESQKAVADWHFYYRKLFAYKPVYELRKFNASLKIPKGDTDLIIFNITFNEVDYYDDEKMIYPEYNVKFHSLNYSAIFDVFFRDESEALETIGVFFCFALIGTIWCWYSCFFYIED